MGWTCSMLEIRSACKISFGKPEGKRPFGVDRKIILEGILEKHSVKL